MNEKPETKFVVECPYCRVTVVLLLPDTGHKTCPVCDRQFNLVNGQPEKVYKLVDTRARYEIRA